MKNKRKLLGLTATASLLSLSAVLASCGKAKEFTVTFKNGTETVVEKPVKEGFNVEVPTELKDQADFNGWYSDSALTKPFDFGSVITENTTVYADWVNKYTVTFDTQGGSTVAPATVKEGYNVAVPDVPTKTKKAFAGWFSDSACTTAFNFGSIITKNTTVYAKWEDATYTVNLYKAEGVLYKTVGVKAEDLVEVGDAPTWNYKTFNGNWYTDPSCTDDYLFDVEADIVEGDMDLYAGWDSVTENVTYKFDYNYLTAYAGGKGSAFKTTGIVTDGNFYIEGGVYFETNENPNFNNEVQPDVNNQQKAIWFTTSSTGKLTFDFKGRSTCKPIVYKVSKVTDNTTVPTFTADDVIWDSQGSSDENIKSGAKGMVEIDLEESATYIIKSSGSGALYNLQYTDIVEKAAPSEIAASGATASFLCGDTFNSDGLNVALKYANGNKEVVRNFTVDATAVDMTKEGTYTVTVKFTASDDYGDYPLETTYEVNVYKVDTITAFDYSLDANRYTVHNKLVYKVGETLDVSKIYVHAYGEIGDAKTDVQLAGDQWEVATAPDMSSVGTKTVTLKYKYDNTVTTTFQIEVVDTVYDATSTTAQVVVNGAAEGATKDANNVYTFNTIEKALQYLALCGVSDKCEKTITLKSGTYNEKVFVDMPNVTIIGEKSAAYGANQVGCNDDAPVIIFNAMNGIKAPNGANYSTDGAASFTLSPKATNCKVENVKIMNYWNTNALYQASLKITKDTQATACWVLGDMSTFDHVSFSSYHDTLYADRGRQYYTDCYIEGRTDYIFGSDATAYFTGCTIKTIGSGLTEKNGGYVVATKGKADMKYGYIFDGCTFTADDNTQLGSVSVARGWDVNMTVMVMNCVMGPHFSDGTHGQTYYVKAYTAETLAKALTDGFTIYTKDAAGKYNKVAKDATFDSTATYYIQLNDRYTRMNADPNPKLLFEYNNTGAGALTYSAELATAMAAKTVTLLNPADTADAAKAAKYADFNEIFGANNGSVSYEFNWNPLAAYDQSLVATVTVNGPSEDNTENFAVSLSNIYVGNTLSDSQLSAVKKAIKDSLKDGYTLVGVYTTATYDTEFTTETELTATTTIYARIVKGTLEKKSLTAYDGDSDSTTTGWTRTGAAPADLESPLNSLFLPTAAGTAVTKSAVEGTPSKEADTLYKANYVKSPTIAEAGVREVYVTIYGGTTESNNSSTFKVIAYNAANEEKGSVTVYSPGSKNAGYFSVDPSKNDNGSGKTCVTTPEKIKVTATEDIAYITVVNTDLKNGSTSSYVGKPVAVGSITVDYEVISLANPKEVTESYALDLATPAATYATKSGKAYLAEGALPNNSWLTVQGKLANKSEGATANDLTSTAFYASKANEIDSLELDKASNQNGTTKAPAALKFTTKGAARITIGFITNGGNAGAFNLVKLAVGTYTLGSDNKPSYKYLTATSNTNCSGASGVYSYDVTMTSKNVATVTYDIEEAGTYYILNPSGDRAVRIKTIEMTDTFVDEKMIDDYVNLTYDKFSALQASNDVQTVEGSFDFVVPNGTSLTGDSTAAQFTGSVSFRVKAGATVTVDGYPGYFNYSINGTAATAAKTSVYFADTTLVTIQNNAAKALYGIKVEFKGAPSSSISQNTNITFGTEGNYKNAEHLTISNAGRDNGVNNTQFSTGTITVRVAAGAKVKVYGFGGGYTFYTVTANGETSAVQNGDYEVTVTAEGDVVITSTDANNYLIKIEITFAA